MHRQPRPAHGASAPFASYERVFALSRTLRRMGEAGSPYARLQRSLATGNPTLAFSAAVELGHPLPLPDALALVLVLVRAGDPRWERAGARWAARYCTETRPSPNGPEARLVVAAVGALGDPLAHSAAIETLHALADGRGLAKVAAVLDAPPPRTSVDRPR